MVSSERGKPGQIRFLTMLVYLVTGGIGPRAKHRDERSSGKSDDKQGIAASGRTPTRGKTPMPSRFSFFPPSNRDERIARARDTLGFCEAMYQIHAQTGDAWGSELLVLKAMQRAAVAVFRDDCHMWDWQ